MSKEELREVEIDETEIDRDTNEECECSSYDDILNEISINEECKRIAKQDEPISKTPKNIKESELYKDVIAKAYMIGESFQILMGFGLDFGNSVNISNNLVQNVYDIEKAKTQISVSETQL